jgi:DNA-binding transcriptional MerR regulator
VTTTIRGGAVTQDERFTRRLYTVAEAARLVGMYPSTLDTWAHGYERRPEGRPVVRKGPVITSFSRSADDARSIPFIGLVEASVVQAFRQTGLPMQRIRRALDVLTQQGERDHALASRQLYSDGADILYDYARNTDDKQLGLLTIVSSGQRVFHDVISHYLERISFDDTWPASSSSQSPSGRFCV